MSELPRPWGTYADLQKKLTQRSCLDDYTWGLEAGLNKLLSVNPPAEEETARAIRSESRKERYRTALRRVYSGPGDSAHNSEDALDARLLLGLTAAQVTAEEWGLLQAVGEGDQYREIAATMMVAAGALRARVLRLRRILSARIGPTRP